MTEPKCLDCNNTGRRWTYFPIDWPKERRPYCHCPAGEALRKRELAERDNASNRGIDRAREKAEERLINEEKRG